MKLGYKKITCTNCCGEGIIKILTWECEKSPNGYCEYNHIEDPLCDFCIYCKQPKERY